MDLWYAPPNQADLEKAMAGSIPAGEKLFLNREIAARASQNHNHGGKLGVVIAVHVPEAFLTDDQNTVDYWYAVEALGIMRQAHEKGIQGGPKTMKRAKEIPARYYRALVSDIGLARASLEVTGVARTKKSIPMSMYEPPEQA